MAIRDTLDWGKVETSLRRARAEIEQRTAATLAERMRLNVPVETGELEASIEVVTNEDGTTAVACTAPYAAAVEFGHLDGSTFVPPNGFGRAAVAEVASEFPGIVQAVGLK